MDQINHMAWEGRTTQDTGSVSPGLAAQLAATTGADFETSNGSPLPPLSHWCAFDNAVPQDQLGADGHPAGSDLLPPSPLQRRMWAGGALEFHAPVQIGDPLRRSSAVRSIQPKHGASGDMVFVTVDHAIYGPRGLAVIERQDIVYLNIPERFSPPKPLAPEGTTVRSLTPDERLLFRYSALTFNAHRIHYDKTYTTEVEKFPGLVVHGPLQATLLMQAAVAHKGAMPKYFDFKGVHPMFAGTQCDIMLREDTASLDLCTAQDGHQCMQATAIWVET